MLLGPGLCLGPGVVLPVPVTACRLLACACPLAGAEGHPFIGKHDSAMRLHAGPLGPCKGHRDVLLSACKTNGLLLPALRSSSLVSLVLRP